VIVVAVPGPSVLFTISRALTAGRRIALLTVVGNAVGLLAQVVAVAFGIGVLVERSVQVFTAVKLLGAGYLVFLGIQAIRYRHSLAEVVSKRLAPMRPLIAVRDGVVVGAMNPKTVAFFVVALPQFTERGSGDLSVQMLVLGALFPLIALVLDGTWAIAAGTVGEWLSRSPRRLAAIGVTGGLVMIGLGLSLATAGRKD